MQQWTQDPSSSDGDLEAAARPDTHNSAPRDAALSARRVRVDGDGEQLEREPLAQRLSAELKPALVVGATVAALAIAAGATVMLKRRRRASGWLTPPQPSRLAAVARGAGVLLLRFAARQAAAQLLAKLESAQQEPTALPPAPASARAQ